jgi:MinD-like ATPase involved in chromosome partitioning or flagellar assembly
MAKIISVHSFRGGTGKSNLTASLAVLAAQDGRRVAVIDTDINSPGIHVVFGLHKGNVARTLNDYLWGRCEICDTAHAVSLPNAAGALWIVPSSLNTGEIAKVLREGYEVDRLNCGFRDLLDGLRLDCLFIDTHPGVNEETLLSIAVSDTLVVILRPDQQDYLGTGVTVEVARRLSVPELYLLVNKVPTNLNFEDVRAKVTEAYGCPVIAVLPHSDRMMELSSSNVFALAYPEHHVTGLLRQVSRRLVPE